MPVDERTYAADVAGWVNLILRDRPDLPFWNARVEEHTDPGLSTRHDFRLYRRHTNTPVLSGEIKMPDTVQGRHPLNAELVNDALIKASKVGVRYCFTWNVRQFVLFDSHIQNVPYSQRAIEGPRDVVDVYQSDDVYRELVKTEVISYWKEFLDQFAALLQGRRSIDPAPLDQRFIAWLEGALEDSIAHTEDAMAARRRIDTEFRGRLDSWMLAQGWEPSPREEQLRRNLERAARLACYILVTRLVFYQVLRRRFSVMNTLSTAGAESSEQLKAILDARFSEAVTYSRDYETVFVPEEGDLGYEIPFISPTAPRDWERLIDRIDEFDLSTIDFDVIGLMYERLIDPNERRRFGQFYTSPDVVDLINAFCIRDANAEVLDPACGGGTFLVRAYARKRVLCEAQEQQSDHQSVLSQIFGIDIAAFPAQLSTINLAVRQLSDEPNYPRVAKANFFDAQVGMPLNNIPLTGDAIRTVPLEPLDAVVGNPPYIRQEKIGAINKYNYRNLFESEWRGQTRLSGRSDIYAYFFTHAAHLLRPGGYLGFVTSIGWLDTDYGFRLQEFFLRNFRIVAVIESQVEKWFEDARVTILQRETDAERRSDNVVRFIQLRKPLVEVFSKAIGGELREEGEANRQAEIEAVRDLIEGVADEQTTDYWRVKRRSQRKLWEAGTGIGRGPDGNDADARYAGGKWGQYIRGPEIWFDLIDRAGDKMVALRELAQVRFGFKTGVDRFFCVRDVTQYYLDAHTDQEDFQQRWGISREDTRRIRIIRDGVNVEHLVERRFLEPELHSLMEVNRPVVRAKDVSRKVINASVSRARLRGTHFDNYVTYAEREGWHTGSTVAARARTRPWYNLALPRKDARAQMFWPMSQQYRHVIPLNRDSLPANHRLFDVTGKDAKLAECLWAALNSTIVALSNGRFQGIEGALILKSSTST